MEILLKKAGTRIEKEMERIGFIDDSDGVDRFLDNLANKLVQEEILKGNEDLDLYYEKENEIEKLEQELLTKIKDKIISNNYNSFSTFGNGDYIGCYYKVDKEFKSWNEFKDYFGIGE